MGNRQAAGVGLFFKTDKQGRYVLTVQIHAGARLPPCSLQVYRFILGICVKVLSGRYYVQMVLPNTSAAATGVVKPGDILELVQNESVVGKSLQQLRSMILGPAGASCPVQKTSVGRGLDSVASKNSCHCFTAVNPHNEVVHREIRSLSSDQL